MKIWFKNNDISKVVSIGKTVGESDESFIKHAGPLEHGFDVEFYFIAGGILVPQTLTEVDAIKAQRATDAKTESTKKAARVAEIKSKLTGMTFAQLDNYIDTNITNMASAKVYLKRLTRIVRSLAKEVGA